jgi:hypothetical protein
MQIIEAEKKAFTEFSKEQLDTLEKAIQIVEPNAFVSKVDYAKGEIKVGIVHNKGTEHEFANDDLITVNVASDSVPAAFYDVFTRAYERLI